MCTVTFSPSPGGYLLGMNRDEKRARPLAFAPAALRLGGRTVLFPAEPSGGTWIGVNDVGVTIALVNWYAVPARVEGSTLSRGAVARAALPHADPGAVRRTLAELPLARVNPFRLVGVFPADRTVREWRWDRTRLVELVHRWKPNTWISSGFDEPGAQRSRSEAFAQSLRWGAGGSVGWLRALHGSHIPLPGPYSTCMHREDAATVSYCEVRVRRERISMRYSPGPLCCTTLLPALILPHLCGSRGRWAQLAGKVSR